MAEAETNAETVVLPTVHTVESVTPMEEEEPLTQTTEIEVKPPDVDAKKKPKTPRYRRTKQYHLYSPEQKATIAKYAVQHGNTKAATRFTKELGIIVPESTIRTFKKAYYARLSEGKQPDEITEIPLRRRGRPRLIKEPAKEDGASPIPKAAVVKPDDAVQIAGTPAFLEMTKDIALSTISVSPCVFSTCICGLELPFPPTI